MTFLRQRWKEKCQIWGPFSRVQSSLFHNLESIYGIDPQTCSLALPCWGPGDQIDYSIHTKKGVNTSVSFEKQSLKIGPSASRITTDGSVLSPLGGIVFMDCDISSWDARYNYFFDTNSRFLLAHDTNNKFMLYTQASLRGLTTATYSNTGKLKIALKHGSNELFINGGLFHTFNAGSIGSNNNVFFIGDRYTGVNSAMNNHISCFMCFDSVNDNLIYLLSDNPNAFWQRVAPISYYFPVGGSGGTVFDVACLDGFNLNDAISRNAIFSAVANETLSLSSSPGNIGNFLTSALSQISMTGSTSTRMILLGNAADSIGVGDVSSALNAITCLVSDNMNLSDSAISEGIFQGSADDSLSLADAVVNSLITQGIINEIVNISDAASLGAFIDAFVNDQINISDGTVNVASLVAAIQDNVNLSDSVTRLLQSLAVASDTINISDLAAWGAVQQALALSGLSLTDSAAANLQLFAQSTDSITFNDASHMTAVFNVAVTDAVSFAETISKIALFQASVADSARFSATAMEVSTLPNGKVTVSFDMKIPGVGFEMKTVTITFNLI